MNIRHQSNTFIFTYCFMVW